MVRVLGAAVLVLVAIAARAPDPIQPPANPWSGPMRDLLVTPCGSCHRSTLPTAKPRALAVFDLEETVWYRHMTDDQIRELARRARASKEIDEWDRPVVDRFERCRLDGKCSPPESSKPGG